ncbi:MAG TPA: Gp138 family membrane-puncturing spike protein [Methanosarcina sp.]|nr:Gp138 family membrane-puncturing spike protein [Methanosarcina sp.]
MRAEERIDDPQEALRLAMEGQLSNLWTALPAIIVSADYTKQTLTAQPTISATITNQQQQKQTVKMPLLVDVPFQCYGGSDFIFTIPNLAGSECLIVFASRCIDSWWQNGGVQNPAEHRMHDLSDGFAIIGFNSQPNKIINYNTSAPELRSRDNATKITMTPSNITITSASVTVNGNMTVNGTIHSTGDTTAGSISLKSHTHGGITTGTSSTGAPQ